MPLYQSINPYTNELLAQFETATDVAIEQALGKAKQAQKQWAQYSFTERAIPVQKLILLIQQQAETLSRMATLEMGKSIQEARVEVNKCITACEYYGSNASEILAPHTTAKERLVYEPMGVILGVFPWNFPYWQIIRSAIPTIMAGNGMIIKPAPNVPQCSNLLQQLFEQAGFPDGVLQTVFASNEQVAKMIADDNIAACTLTGSELAGSTVAAQAGKYIKKTVLELGGSDPFIITQHADMDKVMQWAIPARFQNNGQSCIAAKRFIVHSSMYDIFLARLIPAIEALVCGDPSNEHTQIGPLARVDLKNKLHLQVTQSIAAGATCLYQHPAQVNSDCYYPPTVLVNIPPDSDAYHEELFGPVLSVYVYDTTDGAIQLANDTRFGLGGSVWSENKDEALYIAAQLQCGQVNINSMVKSSATLPFGGYKRSGIGKELGEWGIKEFCNVKVIRF
jgi:succinate-semialdehyde dehydrogenase/glutarate-semialdehyde dehydrogenase